MMTYSEMEREINEIPKFGAKASLSNLSDYLELANHPERNLRVIHIAGTNGKGSVSAYIDSILRQAGYTTALFTSPHLVKINERFRINFKECSDEELILAWCQVKSFMEKGEKQGPFARFGGECYQKWHFRDVLGWKDGRDCRECLCRWST